MCGNGTSTSSHQYSGGAGARRVHGIVFHHTAGEVLKVLETPFVMTRQCHSSDCGCWLPPSCVYASSGIGSGTQQAACGVPCMVGSTSTLIESEHVPSGARHTHSTIGRFEHNEGNIADV